MKTNHAKTLAALPLVNFSETEPATIHSADWFLTVAPLLASDTTFHAVVTLTPREPDGEVPEGVHLTLADGTSVATDIRGQAWFRDLPFGEYALRVGVEESASIVNVVAGSDVVTLAAKSEPTIPCQTGDLRVLAVLGKDFVLSTNDPALATARFSFVVGSAHYEGRFIGGEARVRRGADFPAKFDRYLDEFEVHP